MQTVALTPHPLQNTSLPCGWQGVNGCSWAAPSPLSASSDAVQAS